MTFSKAARKKMSVAAKAREEKKRNTKLEKRGFVDVPRSKWKVGIFYDYFPTNQKNQNITVETDNPISVADTWITSPNVKILSLIIQPND
jgi:hypothetical protein